MNGSSSNKMQGLTPEGWRFLVDLLEAAGYQPRNANGRFVARKLLREHFYEAYYPEREKEKKNKDKKQKTNKEQVLHEKDYLVGQLVKVGARLQRLKPGPHGSTVTEQTLRALADLKAFKDPNLFEHPAAALLLKEVVGADPYSIDFLRFCRKLTVPFGVGEPKKLTDQSGGKEPKKNEVSELNDKPNEPRPHIYLGCVAFNISKTFANLQLIPEIGGLRLLYIPIVKSEEIVNSIGYLDLVIPLEGVGGILGTALAFLEKKMSLDENVILQGDVTKNEHDILIKLYRDKPHGSDGQLTGVETCWLRVVTGKAEEERRRMLLTPRDLISLIEACRLTAILAVATPGHKPVPVVGVNKVFNPSVMNAWQEIQEKSPNT